MSNALAEALTPEVEGFFNAEPGALGRVYATMHGFLINVALKAGLEYVTDAEDAASDAILYVQGWERKRPNTTGSQLFGMLTWAAKIMARRQRAAAGRTVTFSTQEEGGDGDLEYVEDLEGMEERRIAEGADAHEYLTSIETDTPEEIALRGNLRQHIERTAVEACGQKHWNIYHAIVVDERSQREVGEQYDLSQQRVSQIVGEVQTALRAALMGVRE